MIMSISMSYWINCKFKMICEVEDKALAEELHKTLVAVTDLLQQHLTDEEDLVIPILGLRQG